MTENLTFTECKKICYNSVIFTYLKVLVLLQGCLSLCDGLTFFYVFQQTITSCAPPTFVLLMLKHIVKKYLDPHFNKSFKNLLYWFAINFYIFHTGPDTDALAFFFPFILPKSNQEMEKNYLSPNLVL